MSVIELLHGDCLDLMGNIPDGAIDMILADLPYGTTACKWDTIIPLEPLWEHYKRLIKRNGAIVLTASQPFTSALVMSNPKWFKHEWIWEKDKATGHLLANKVPLKAHENILVFCNGHPPYYPQKSTGHEPSNKSSKVKQAGRVYHDYVMYQGGGTTTRFPRSVFRFNTVNSAHGIMHPTQKPVALMEYLIRTYTNEGETVLDNAMGSGTTLVGCVNTGRNGIGIEKDPEYFAIAQKRVNDTLCAPRQAQMEIA